VVTSSKDWISPTLMVAEWEAAVSQFTMLTPHLYYSASSCRRTSHHTAHPGKPLRIVMILTTQTFYQHFNQEEAEGLKL